MSTTTEKQLPEDRSGIVKLLLSAITLQARQTIKKEGNYHVLAYLVENEGTEPALSYTINHFTGGMVDGSCTSGLGDSPEDALIDLAAKIGSPSVRAAKLRAEADRLNDEADRLSPSITKVA